MSENALQVVKNHIDKLNYSDELSILEHLFKKYNLKTISDYSKENNINRQAIYNQIEKGQVMNIELTGITFIAK